MATSVRRRQPKSPAPPIDLDEIEQDPGFRGMLSFLEVSPEDRSALLARRAEAESQTPTGEAPAGNLLESLQGDQSPAGVSSIGEPPEALSPTGHSPDIAENRQGVGDSPEAESPTAQGPVGRSPVGFTAGRVPYMDVEGRGKRPLRFCQTVQDGHTATEHLAYQTLWNTARTHGQPEPSGASLLDIGLSQLCLLLGADHKNIKRLLGALQDKLALEVVRQPDYRRAIPTRYRIFNESQVLERRRAAGLVWVVRTRAIRFVDLATVQKLMGDLPGGELPMGASHEPPVSELPAAETPMGRAAQPPADQPPPPDSLAASLNRWIPIGDDAVRQLWDACRRGAPDCTEEEIDWFCRSKQPLIRSGQIDNPVALLIRSVPQVFAGGGSAALEDYRKERARERERERRRERQVALMALDDPESGEAELAWAREVLAEEQGSAPSRRPGRETS